MTTNPFDAKAAARFIAEAHKSRATYQNLPDAIAPKTVGDAYAAQEALRPLWEPIHGPVAGLKIATTTKVMQQLMGIDHPCGGMIYGKRIHASPAKLKLSEYINVMIECELAVRVGETLAKKAQPYTATSVRGAVTEVIPAFELIEDRRAVYKETRALSLIADNAWNAGIVIGSAVKMAAGKDLNGIEGRLSVNGKVVKSGKTDGPMDALAWIANLAADRGRPLQAGMVVITGSVIPTVPVAAGDKFVFELDGIGKTEFTAAA